MEANINCEVVLPNSKIILEAGQQIVNNGVPIDGIFCLIDTAYAKDYIIKVKKFPMNVMKTNFAFNKISALPTLLSLFKCMDRTCIKTFSNKKLFEIHMQKHFSKYAGKKQSKKFYFKSLLIQNNMFSY